MGTRAHNMHFHGEIRKISTFLVEKKRFKWTYAVQYFTLYSYGIHPQLSIKSILMFFKPI